MKEIAMKEWIQYNLLSRGEIVEQYNVKPSYVDVSISRGKIKPFIKKGSRIALYLRKDVEAYLKYNK